MPNPDRMAQVLWLLACFALLSAGVLGFFDCEELAIEDCAFAVSESGERCVLEKRMTRGRTVVYECQTSSVLAQKIEAWIETDECLTSCGLQRMSVGMSTDGLVQRDFLDNWCSETCQNNCPNIIDLYIKLAAGEDIFLPHLCTYLRPSSRRLIGESAHLSKGTLDAIISLETSGAAKESSMKQQLELAPTPSF